MKLAALLLLAGCDRFLKLDTVEYMPDAPATDAAIDAPPPPATVVQAMSDGMMSAPFLVLTLQDVPSTSNTLIVICGCENGGGAVSGAGTWQQAASSEVSATEYLWVGRPDGINKTIRFDAKNAGAMWMMVSEWTGLDPLNPVDGIAAHGVGMAGPATGTIDLSMTTSSAPDLLVFAAAAYGIIDPPPGTWGQLPQAKGNYITQRSYIQFAFSPGMQRAQTPYTVEWDAVFVALRTKP